MLLYSMSLFFLALALFSADERPLGRGKKSSTPDMTQDVLAILSWASLNFPRHNETELYCTMERGPVISQKGTARSEAHKETENKSPVKHHHSSQPTLGAKYPSGPIRQASSKKPLVTHQ